MNKSHFYSVQPKQYLGKIESFLNGFLDEVSVKEALYEENTLIDVRTAQEYEKGSIPDAFNYPLFDNLERTEIGVIYRKIGKNAAVVKGKEFFEPRIQQFLSSLTDLKSLFRLEYLFSRCGGICKGKRKGRKSDVIGTPFSGKSLRNKT